MVRVMATLLRRCFLLLTPRLETSVITTVFLFRTTGPHCESIFPSICPGRTYKPPIRRAHTITLLPTSTLTRSTPPAPCLQSARFNELSCSELHVCRILSSKPISRTKPYAARHLPRSIVIIPHFVRPATTDSVLAYFVSRFWWLHPNPQRVDISVPGRLFPATASAATPAAAAPSAAASRRWRRHRKMGGRRVTPMYL